MWRTFQDRLRSELRLAKASALEAANGVLDRFVKDFNRRFAAPAREAGDDFRRLPKKLNLDRLFSLRYERTVGHDHVIAFGARPVQLPPAKGKFGYAGLRVEVSHQLHGELHIWNGQQHLHMLKMPLEYAPGQAPKRPTVSKRKLPRVHVLGGRVANAWR